MNEKYRNEYLKRIYKFGYRVLYSFILAISFLTTTMFSLSLIVEISVISLMGIVWVLFGYRYFVAEQDKSYSLNESLVELHSKWEIGIAFILFIGFLGATIFTGYTTLVLNLVLILGAYKVPFEKIIKLYCLIAGVFIVVTIISSQVGLVENLVYGTDREISFGFNSPTDFAAHTFFLTMGWCYLRKEKLRYVELAGIMAVGILTLALSGARTNAICMTLTFFVFLYLKTKTRISERNGYRYEMNSNLRKLLTLAIPVCALLFIGLTVLYHMGPHSGLLETMNRLLSRRLQLGSMGLKRYGIHLFGSYFQMRGTGGNTANWTPGDILPDWYFFLDSSYVMILLRYGILVFLGVMAAFILIARRADKRGDIALLCIISLIAVQSMIEHHLIEIAYNPFLLLLLADAGSENRKEHFISRFENSRGVL